MERTLALCGVQFLTESVHRDIRIWLCRDNRVCKTSEESAMLRNFDSFRLRRGTLYREVTAEGEKSSQLVLPKSMVKDWRR
jgi:hypothetical protein